MYQYRNRRVHIPDGYIAVGLIIGAHGLRGEVKVEVHTDFPERFSPGSTLFLGEKLNPVEIEHVRPHKNQLLMRFEDVVHRDDADRLRGLWLFIPESEAMSLEDDHFWIHDIVGLTVETVSGDKLGAITDVLPTGANDVYIIKPPSSVNRGKDILLPAIADVIQTVDLEKGKMVVELPEGLLDQ